MKEDITLEDREGQSAGATALVDRYSSGARLGKGVGIAVGGLVLGAATIVIPGVHLISTWAIPLLAFGIAWYFYNKLGAVTEVQGTCPSCGASMQSEGGAWEDPMWVRCSGCNTPLQVKLSAPMG